MPSKSLVLAAACPLMMMSTVTPLQPTRHHHCRRRELVVPHAAETPTKGEEDQDLENCLVEDELNCAGGEDVDQGEGGEGEARDLRSQVLQTSDFIRISDRCVWAMLHASQELTHTHSISHACPRQPR